MIAQLYLLQANCQLTGSLLKAAQKYIISVKQPRCYLFAQVVKLSELFWLCSVAFSLYLAVFRLYSILYGYPVSLFYLILKQGKTPAQPAYAFACTQEAELMPYSWLRLQKNSFQVTQGTDHSWKHFSDRYMGPFIHLQNTIKRKIFDKIAFILWLNVPASGKGSSTSSLTLHLLRQLLIRPVSHSLPPHLLCLQVYGLSHPQVTSTRMTVCSKQAWQLFFWGLQIPLPYNACIGHMPFSSI